jgi:hypothetical protein
MDIEKTMKEIETQYSVGDITVDNIQIWGLLRTLYIAKCIDKNITSDGWNKHIKRQPNPSTIKKIKRLRNISYGIHNVFRKYDLWVFSDGLELRELNGKLVNRLFEPILKEKSCVLVENPATGLHVPLAKRDNKSIISLDIFNIMAQLIKYKEKTIDGEEILREINNEYDLQVDYHRAIHRFFAYRRVFGKFLDIYRPKAVILSSYAGPTFQTLIHTAKEKGIPTIEMQHGAITKNFPFYTPCVVTDKKFFPDYILTFGEKSKKEVRHEFIDPKNIFSVGIPYLEYINETHNEKLVEQFQEIRQRYKHIVAVTAQWTVESKLINFIKNSAVSAPEIVFIYIPRDASNNYKNIFPKNVMVMPEFNAYQLIKYSDFHATVYSTCVIEAPFFGVRNILINIDGRARQTYGDMLTNEDVSLFVESEAEFVHTIRTWGEPKKESVIKSHSDFLATHPNKRLLKTIEQIIANGVKV